jgi:hypothetical protein
MKGRLPRLGVELMRYMGTRLSAWIFQWIKMVSGGRSWRKETGMVGKDGQSVLDL